MLISPFTLAFSTVIKLGVALEVRVRGDVWSVVALLVLGLLVLSLRTGVSFLKAEKLKLYLEAVQI